MKPSEALRHPADLVKALAPGTATAAALDSTAVRNQVQRVGATSTSAYVANHVRTGRLFIVTAAMVSVVQTRFESLHHLPVTGHAPRDVAPPSVTGVVVLEEPVAFLAHVEGQRRVQLAHVLTWGPATATDPHGQVGRYAGWSLTLWNDASRRPDDLTRATWTANPDERGRRWWSIGALFLGHGQRFGSVSYPVNERDRRRWAVQYPHLDEDDLPPLGEPVPNLFRYWPALWQLFA